MVRVIGISVVVLSALVLALAWVHRPENWPPAEPTPYQGEGADLVEPKHSEAALGRLIREPQNTWSNLVFVFGGAFVLVTSRTRGARMLGIPLIAVGAGSFLYHASASARLRQGDVAAM